MAEVAENITDVKAIDSETQKEPEIVKAPAEKPITEEASRGRFRDSRSRTRSRSPKRRRSFSRSPIRDPRRRERSFSLSPIRTKGYQPKGFSRTTRGFVKELPGQLMGGYNSGRGGQSRNGGGYNSGNRNRSPVRYQSRSPIRSLTPKRRSPSRSPRRNTNKSKYDSSRSHSRVSDKNKKNKKPKKIKKRRKSSSSSSSSSSSDSSDDEKTIKKTKSSKKPEYRSDGVMFLPISDDFDISKERKRTVVDSKASIQRHVSETLKIGQVRQMVLHNPISGAKPIFDHVDCTKLPKNPEKTGDHSTSVAGGDLLAAMFGTANDEEAEEITEPELLKQKRALLAKEEKPRGTTGIKIHERITWWQENNSLGKNKKKKKKSKDEKKPKKEKKQSKKKEVSSDSDVEPKKMRMDGSPTTYTRTVNRGKSRSPIDLRSPVRKLASRNSKAMSMSRSRSRSISRSRSRSISRGRRDRGRGREYSRGRGNDRRSSGGNDSRIKDHRQDRSRKRSVSNGGSSVDETRQPCVFYFSRDAKGCKWNPRECKFSHDQEDYDYWVRKGRTLPNTGLIFRTSPVRKRRSLTPRR